MLPPHPPIAPPILSISFHLSLWGERYLHTRVCNCAHTHKLTQRLCSFVWGNCPHSVPYIVYFPWLIAINSKFSNGVNPHSWPLPCFLLFWGHLHCQNLNLIRLTDELLCSSLCLSHPLLYFLLSPETKSLIAPRSNCFGELRMHAHSEMRRRIEWMFRITMYCSPVDWTLAVNMQTDRRKDTKKLIWNYRSAHYAIIQSVKYVPAVQAIQAKSFMKHDLESVTEAWLLVPDKLVWVLTLLIFWDFLTHNSLWSSVRVMPKTKRHPVSNSSADRNA